MNKKTEVPKGQLERFKEAARDLGADDDEAKFNDKLRKLVRPKADDKEPPAKNLGI